MSSIRAFGGKRANGAAANLDRVIARETAGARQVGLIGQPFARTFGIVRWYRVPVSFYTDDRSSAILTQADGTAVSGSPRVWINTFQSIRPVGFGPSVYELELTGRSITKGGVSRPEARVIRVVIPSQQASEVEVISVSNSGKYALVRPLYAGSPITVDVEGTADDHNILFRPLGGNSTVAAGHLFDVARLPLYVVNFDVTYVRSVTQFGTAAGEWEMQPEHAERYRAGNADHQDGGSNLSIDIGEPFIVYVGIDVRDDGDSTKVRRVQVWVACQFDWSASGLCCKFKTNGPSFCSGFTAAVSGANINSTTTSDAPPTLSSARSNTAVLTMNSSNTMATISSSYGSLNAFTCTPTQDGTTGRITAISMAHSAPSGYSSTVGISIIGGRPVNRITF